MLKNLGKPDRIVRVLVAVALITVLALGMVSGWFAGLLAIVAAYVGLTGLIGHCPAYKAIDIDTADNEHSYHPVDI